MKTILSVVGARPNFMKIAPIHKQFKKYDDVRHLICHTGQHYDAKMSKVFFQDLELPEPDFYLGVGSGSHAEQTARIMVEFEKVIASNRPDLVVVVGDVNSTIACGLVASKSGIPLAHVEAGLRSFDRTMPEEINRLLTDAISDYLFVTEQSGIDNLMREGISKKKVFFVGNVMIDSVVHYLEKASQSNVLTRFSVSPLGYTVATFHRPSNVDTPEGIRKVVEFLNSVAEERKVVFPAHPRTKAALSSISKSSLHKDVILTEPVGYIDFLWLMQNASLVVTDSGGIQEETTFLGIPCITLRENTERPVTVEQGTNHLAGGDFKKASRIAKQILLGKLKRGKRPKLWDGEAAERIAAVLVRKLGKASKK